MNVGVIGASGRMGQAVIAALTDTDSQLSAAVVSDNSACLGQQVGSVHYQTLAHIDGPVEVLIDFSLPDALADNLAYAQQHKLPIVVCTTGLNEDQQQLLQQAAQQTPVLYARNTSVGVALLEQLVALSAAVMADADVEIFEAHHKHKKDAPSGTALALGEAVAKGRKQSFAAINAGLRGDGQRAEGSVGFSVMRAADIVGEHQVLLADLGERLELNHKVSDRAIFAKGALRAAEWLTQQPKGLYQMQDILDLKARIQELL